MSILNWCKKLRNRKADERAYADYLRIEYGIDPARDPLTLAVLLQSNKIGY